MYHIIVNARDYDEIKQKKVETVKAVFDRAGKEYKIYFTKYHKHAQEIAAKITESGEFAQLIAMGGDGTLHEVLNGIKDMDNCTLGLIPSGTGNDFAAGVHLPFDVKEAAENIAFRAPVYIDYIELENGLRSLNTLGCGLDVEILKRAYSGKRKDKKKYNSAFLKSLFHYKVKPYTITYDGITEKHKAILTELGNGTYVGGGINLFPESNVTDGAIDLIIVNYLSRISTISAFIKLKRGKINDLKEVTSVKCKSVKITPDDGVLPTVQIEGELYENVQISAKIVSGKLKFYLPKND